MPSASLLRSLPTRSLTASFRLLPSPFPSRFQMSNWPASKPRRVLAALERIGWRVKTPAELSSVAHAPGLTGLRVWLSRSRRDWPADVGESRQADWVEARRSLTIPHKSRSHEGLGAWHNWSLCDTLVLTSMLF